jgi:oxygen-independent coproporphyrinogen-3 oxidase
MRMFSMPLVGLEVGQTEPVYCCQDDGMIGLGCGARSYTRTLHYSSEYAVKRPGVKRILADYAARDDFHLARHGARLDAEEQRRRYAIKSLLQTRGLYAADYRERFGTRPETDLPQLLTLIDLGLASLDAGCLRLTPVGLERSDVIGPWLYSEAVRRLSEMSVLQRT